MPWNEAIRVAERPRGHLAAVAPAHHTEARWIENWKALARRYVGDPTVVGCDLFNEVHAGPGHPGPYWDADGANEAAAASRSDCSRFGADATM